MTGRPVYGGEHAGLRVACGEHAALACGEHAAVACGEHAALACGEHAARYGGAAIFW